jgi:hypothetical protein
MACCACEFPYVIPPLTFQPWAVTFSVLVLSFQISKGKHLNFGLDIFLKSGCVTCFHSWWQRDLVLSSKHKSLSLWRRLFLFTSLVSEVPSLIVSMFLFWHGICLVPHYICLHFISFFNFHTWNYMMLKTCLFCILWEFISSGFLRCITPVSHGWSSLKHGKTFIIVHKLFMLRTNVLYHIFSFSICNIFIIFIHLILYYYLKITHCHI